MIKIHINYSKKTAHICNLPGGSTINIWLLLLPHMPRCARPSNLSWICVSHLGNCKRHHSAAWAGGHEAIGIVVDGLSPVYSES